MKVICEKVAATCPAGCPHRELHEPIMDTHYVDDDELGSLYLDGLCSDIAGECGWIGGVAGPCKCIDTSDPRHKTVPALPGMDDDGNSPATGHARGDASDSGKGTQGQ